MGHRPDCPARRQGAESGIRPHPARGARPAGWLDCKRVGCRQAGVGGVRLSLRLSGGRGRAPHRHGVDPFALGLARGADRGRAGQRQQPLRGRSGNQPDISRRWPVVGPPGQVELPDNSSARIGANGTAGAPAGAPHRRPSCKGCQDRLAARLCRLSRLTDAAGPACTQAPDGGPAHRGPRCNLALRDRLARARRTGGDRRGLPLAPQE